MINIDQKHRFKEIDAQVAVDKFMVNAMIGFLIFAAVVLMFSVLHAANAAPVEHSVVGATTDNLMSPERAEFMVLFEHGEEFTEEDMQ